MTDPPLADAPRSRRPIWLAVGVIVAALLVVVLVWFQPHKLVIDDTVSEPLPGLDLGAPTEVSGGAPAVVPPEAVSPNPATTMNAADMNAVEDTTAAVPTTIAAPIETAATVVEDGPSGLSGAHTLAAQSGAPQVAAASEFISLDHGTSGTALVVALPDGGVTLRFEDLDTSNGPDLYVVLTPHAADSGNYDGRLQLGRLKGNRGDQNYDIPPGTDLTAFRSVVIWCERFSSPFGAAPVEVM